MTSRNTLIKTPDALVKNQEALVKNQEDLSKNPKTSVNDQGISVKSQKITDVDSTVLAQELQSLLAEHPGQSGVFPLTSGKNAFLARLWLVRTAEKTLDLQYYIWRKDPSGHELIAAVLDAADRGVRVRILLDDVGSPIGDGRLLMLSQHSNVDVCLYNPLGNRAQRAWSMMMNFRRSNRRMHNKSLTADNRVTIVGGRNIGDEYFDVGHEIAFADLDVVAIGSVVDEVTDSFDVFWNSSYSHPIESLVKKTFTQLQLRDVSDNIRAKRKPLDLSDTLQRMLNLTFPDHSDANKWYWGDAQVLYDSPKKSEGDVGDQSSLLLLKLSKVASKVKNELLLISPYFVPGRRGLKYFKQLRARGVNVTIVTNSLSATDVGLVHSGYLKYRKRLLKIGVSIFEVPSDGSGFGFSREDGSFQAAEDLSSNSRIKASIKPFLSSGKAKVSRYIGSSSRGSLHAKAYFIDREKTFVGSMNLDPRSILINTEIGVLIDNPEMAATAVDNITESLKGRAYKLSLHNRRRLVWEIQEKGKLVRYYADPKTSVLQRTGVWLLSLIPIEAQL